MIFLSSSNKLTWIFRIFLSSSNELTWIFRISSLKAGFQNKIAPSLAPLLGPFEFLKSMESHLSLEQKIKAIAVLDNLLAVFKNSSLYIVENRDFQLYHVKIWKFDFSLQISNRTKFWSKIVTTLIFFFQWKLRFHTFQKFKRGAKRGAREWAILIENSNIFFKFWILETWFRAKYILPRPPFWPLLFNFWKVWNLSFHWKKKLMSYPS